MCCSEPGNEYEYRLEEINLLLIIIIIVIKQCLFLLLLQWGAKDQLHYNTMVSTNCISISNTCTWV